MAAQHDQTFGAGEMDEVLAAVCATLPALRLRPMLLGEAGMSNERWIYNSQSAI
jgi:hypothetical protein